MRISVLDAATLGADLDLSIFSEVGICDKSPYDAEKDTL